MTEEQRKKVFELRCKSKMGTPPTKKELKFLMLMLEKYPEDYKSMNKEIFEATKPFGCI